MRLRAFDGIQLASFLCNLTGWTSTVEIDFRKSRTPNQKEHSADDEDAYESSSKVSVKNHRDQCEWKRDYARGKRDANDHDDPIAATRRRRARLIDGLRGNRKWPPGL